MSSASALASSIQFSSACFHVLEVSSKEENVGMAVGFVAFSREACFVLLIMMPAVPSALTQCCCNCESKLCEWIFFSRYTPIYRGFGSLGLR